MAIEPNSLITGIILAGGRGRRLSGQDKGLVRLQGRPLISRVIQVLAPQVATLLINANRSLADYRALGYQIVSDATPDFRGPLAGLAAGFAACKTEWLLAVPCDMPYLPHNLAERLFNTAQAAHLLLSIPFDQDKIHWACVLAHRDLAGDLITYLNGNDRSVRGWITQYNYARCDFSNYPQAFANFNTWEDLRRIEEMQESA